MCCRTGVVTCQSLASCTALTTRLQASFSSTSPEWVSTGPSAYTLNKAEIPCVWCAACLSFSKFVKERQSSLLFSIAVTLGFVPIGPWNDPLAAFTFAFGRMEAPQCTTCFSTFCRIHICIRHTACMEL